jgi:hypothetical protein
MQTSPTGQVLQALQYQRVRPLHDVGARVSVQHEAGHQSVPLLNGQVLDVGHERVADATGAVARYVFQSLRARGEDDVVADPADQDLIGGELESPSAGGRPGCGWS